MIERVIELNGKGINEWVSLGGKVMARRYNIIGTNVVKYALYVALNDQNFKEYPSTIRHENVLYGDFSTWNVIAGLDQFKPGSPERCKLVDEHYANLKQIVEIAVKLAFPADFVEEVMA